MTMMTWPGAWRTSTDAVPPISSDAVPPSPLRGAGVGKGRADFLPSFGGCPEIRAGPCLWQSMVPERKNGPPLALAIPA